MSEAIVTFQCGCGVKSTLTLTGPMLPEQYLGCLACGQLYQFKTVRPESATDTDILNEIERELQTRLGSGWWWHVEHDIHRGTPLREAFRQAAQQAQKGANP